MTKPILLKKENPLTPAEDYVALRKEGFKSIEHSANSNWTEYNNSDPGITMLEAVCYAITDLGYRTGFEMKDLLAPEKLTQDTWKNIFYTARKILHNSALTLNDYRKMIIDIKGVRNAWIETSKNYEVPLWINYNHFSDKKDNSCECGDDGIDVACYGKLLLDPVNEAQVTDDAMAIIEHEITKLEKRIADLRIKETELVNGDSEKNARALERVRKKISFAEKKKTALEKEIDRLQDWTFIPSKIVELEGLYNVMVEFEEDVLNNKEREEVRSKVVDKLSGHRNLCEDFLTVNPVEYQDFGIAGSIALEEDADPDAVLAEIFFIIYKYFSPSIPFYTIDQMLEKGYSVEDIFEGPPLKHGFIESSDLEKTDLFRDIRLSDIINEIVDIKGVKAITFLRLPFLGFDDKPEYFNEWITLLREEKLIARVQPSLSTMMFCKERAFITYNVGAPDDRGMARVLKLFDDLKARERKYKLEGIIKDFPVPSGENMELEDYVPLIDTLPMCYGIGGRAGLPADASPKRKVQALQLKGYLLFFEQILSDYLVQLNHVRDLFTFDNSVKRTYFTRLLTEIDDLQKLVIDHQDRKPENWDLILEDFTNVLEHLVETPKLFDERRNKFLNHMLARFGEDLTEYENISRWLTPHNVERRLIRDKTAILADGEYYNISTNRGRGYNYASHDFWHSTNVSGTEQRVGRLLGFRSVERRSLIPEMIVVEPLMETESKKKHHDQKKNKEGKALNVIKIIDPESKKVLLTSVEVVEGCCTDELINEILKYADDRIYFRFSDELKHHTRKSAANLGTFSFELWDNKNTDEGVLLASGEKFDSQKDRETSFKRLQHLLDEMNDNEGFHFLEHILLRPKLDEVLDEVNEKTEVKLLNVCLDVCDLGKGLDEGAVPEYRKVIRRIPAKKCYDKMPWILEYHRLLPAPSVSILFQEAFPEEEKNIPLKFRRYELLTKRIRDLQVYGSERINYTIISNEEADPAALRYSFIIHGENGLVLAQSAFMFSKSTREQIDSGDLADNDINVEIRNLMQYFSFEQDLYCAANPCDHNEDPYSFRATAVFPCWPKRFRDATFRGLVEKTIQTQAPAHIHINVKWIGVPDMQKFEKRYYNWLQEMSQTEMPSYEIVNPLVHVLDNLKPCGCCEDECG
jgi:hypothetical protein